MGCPSAPEQPPPPPLSSPQQGELNSFLWTIRRDPPAYLFGTIHVPYTRVWDFIPDNSKAAFHASSSVYFELDLTDPYTISGLASCQMLPHGENLQDVLPRELYRRLKRHLDYIKLMLPHWMTPDQRGKGLYADYLFNAIAGNWERKRPVWVMLMVNSLTETDIRSRGVPVLDLYLAQEAERMKKTTGAVERVEEQCHPLNGLNFSQVRRLLGLVAYPRRWAPFSSRFGRVMGASPEPAAAGWVTRGPQQPLRGAARFPSRRSVLSAKNVRCAQRVLRVYRVYHLSERQMSRV